MTTQDSSDAAPQPQPQGQGRHVAVAVGRRGLEFGQLDELIRFANGLIVSGMVPPGMKAGGVVAVIQAGAEIGMPPMWSLAHLTFVRGKLGIDGAAALALVRKSDVCRPDGQPTFRSEGEPFTPGWSAVVSAHRRDRATPVEYAFSLREAIQMGLVKLDEEKRQVWGRAKNAWSDDVPWATATADMLQWRAWARMHKREFGDVTMGLSLIEELRDTKEPERDITDAVTVAAARRPAQLEGGVDPLLAELQSAGSVEDAELVEAKPQ